MLCSKNAQNGGQSTCNERWAHAVRQGCSEMGGSPIAMGGGRMHGARKRAVEAHLCVQACLRVHVTHVVLVEHAHWVFGVAAPGLTRFNLAGSGALARRPGGRVCVCIPAQAAHRKAHVLVRRARRLVAHRVVDRRAEAALVVVATVAARVGGVVVVEGSAAGPAGELVARVVGACSEACVVKRDVGLGRAHRAVILWARALAA
eukprot:330293-Chlamydomonas_euryale.AAC.1